MLYELQQNKYETKGGKLSEREETQTPTTSALIQWNAKSLEGKLLPSIKMKDLTYNEADTEISISNPIPVLSCDLTRPGHSFQARTNSTHAKGREATCAPHILCRKALPQQ